MIKKLKVNPFGRFDKSFDHELRAEWLTAGKLRTRSEKLKVNFGFTLVELILVISVGAIISLTGIAAFVKYSQSQSLDTAANELIDVFSLAKSRAFSQVKPPSCTGTLTGYEITLDTKDHQYSLDVVCSISRVSIIANKKLPPNITFKDPPSTDPTSYFFPLFTGGVRRSGIITLEGYGRLKSLTVDSQGNIR